MKITRIIIENFKSISHIDIKVSDKINVFIGGNSVGKSNIFDAINWPLGPIYPSFNSTIEQDHYLGELDNKIKIRLYFDNDKYLELAEEWVDNRGSVKSGLNLSNNYITNENRQAYSSAYLGIDRQILDYLPSNRWSLIGRILLEINKLFQKEEIINEETGESFFKSDIFKNKIHKIRDDLLFSVKDEDGREIMKEFISILQKESAKQLNRTEEEFSVDLNLYDPWNFYRTLQLIVKEPETDMQFQASNLGMANCFRQKVFI
ncbi:MAG TPA: AAA family ATPase [bacterium]|nr:AAA family ATPase [bacterium]HPN41850.1 AAA family ATPase [bacterium]